MNEEEYFKGFMKRIEKECEEERTDCDNPTTCNGDYPECLFCPIYEKAMSEAQASQQKDMEEENAYRNDVQKTINFLQATKQKIVNLKVRFTKMRAISDEACLLDLEKLQEELGEFMEDIGSRINLYFPSEPPNLP